VPAPWEWKGQPFCSRGLPGERSLSGDLHPRLVPPHVNLDCSKLGMTKRGHSEIKGNKCGTMGSGKPHGRLRVTPFRFPRKMAFPKPLLFALSLRLESDIRLQIDQRARTP
jgi:hypothetical protein